jgi:signal transduction histidine kinase/ActR/RegA family two-component response regulator
MLSDVREARELTSNPEVIVLPISFGATVLGTLRVAMPKGRLPTPADREIARLLAIQGGVAIINAQFTQEVVRMRSVSEESVKAKTGFLANLSHEIRGPLGIILNAVELVLEGLCGTVSDEQAQTLRMVQTNGAHLLELINDVLDYAKLEAGKVGVQPVDIQVNELLRDLSGVVRAQAEAKSHRLLCREVDAALAVRCDRRHARQMLINLLTNAIKYTPDGGTIELFAERGAGGKVKISVKDSGVGIEESQRHKVFAAFERVEQAYALHQVGTGLGMPLTRKLAEANGGQVDFQSAPGKGSVFWIQLPAVACSAETIAQEVVQEVQVQGSNDLVLLVERDEGELGMHARALTHAGFRVGSACGKIDAVTLAMQNKFALAIIDNAIIDEVGDDFVGQLRATSKDATLPILVLTSRAFVFDVENYLRLGIDRCVAKPVSIRDLLKTARELIDDARMARELKGRRPVPQVRSPRDQSDKLLH